MRSGERRPPHADLRVPLPRLRPDRRGLPAPRPGRGRSAPGLPGLPRRRPANQILPLPLQNRTFLPRLRHAGRCRRRRIPNPWPPGANRPARPRNCPPISPDHAAQRSSPRRPPVPIYEYRCQQCGHVQEQFHRSLDRAKAPACESCPSTEMERVISRFATPKTESQVLDQYGTPGPGAGPDAYRDPRQIGRWAEERFDQMESKCRRSQANDRRRPRRRTPRPRQRPLNKPKPPLPLSPCGDQRPAPFPSPPLRGEMSRSDRGGSAPPRLTSSAAERPPVIPAPQSVIPALAAGISPLPFRSPLPLGEGESLPPRRRG